MTDTTTSAVDQLAVALDGHHRVESPMFTGDAHVAAAALRALVAERDRLREVLTMIAEARPGPVQSETEEHIKQAARSALEERK